MKTTNRILEYLRLFRLQGAAGTAAVALITRLVMEDKPHNLFLLFVLFIICLLCHIFTYVFNEYIDIKIDKESQDLKKKPLVSGTISKNHALLIAFIATFFAYILTIIFFWSLYAICFLTLALLFGGIYDLFGKKIPGSDLLIAGSTMFLCLFGASTVSSDFSNLIYIISFAILFHVIFDNAIEGGLKDVDHDFLAGAKTTVTRLGVKVLNNKIIVTKRFVIFAYSTKIIFMILIFLASLQPEVNIWFSGKYMIQIAVIFLIIIIFGTLYKFWHPPDFNRPKMIRLFGIHEITSYFLGPIILIPLIGTWYALLLLLVPPVWFIIVNITLYGKPMQPRV
jgi:4-hydroxybenzoate polyprenyltransferase